MSKGKVTRPDDKRLLREPRGLLACKIDEELRLRGWSIAHLAKLAGVPRTTLTSAMRGNGIADKLAVKIAVPLGLELTKTFSPRKN